MTTTFTILNLIFMAAILVAVVGLLSWGIATQSRDRVGQALDRRRRIDHRAPVGRSLTVRSTRVQRPYGHGIA
jgi:hypothetical protein